jgi:iron(III) transport system ATP-binding protein
MVRTVHTEPIGVRIEHLSKLFSSGGKEKDFLAVDDVSLDVEPGRLVTLLGPSGCGKTTILRMLSGFITPTQGRILLGGQDMTDTPPNKRDVGMMFQSYALFPHMTVFENVAYGLRVKKIPKLELEERVKAVLELMHIEEYANRIPERLSGGQQQRVALARAIVTEPKILLFDEPLSNLDAKMREYMRDELRKIQQRLKITSIYVTHDQAEALAISDKVVIMNRGRIEQEGKPPEIYRAPVNRFVADFMGKANFTKARVEPATEGTVTVRTLGHALTVAKDAACDCETGSSAVCMIRPEHITISDDGEVDAVVTRATYLGSYTEYEVEAADETILVHDRNIESPVCAVGDRVKLKISGGHMRVLRG